jgi:hypothetical protein
MAHLLWCKVEDVALDSGNLSNPICKGLTDRSESSVIPHKVYHSTKGLFFQNENLPITRMKICTFVPMVNVNQSNNNEDSPYTVKEIFECIKNCQAMAIVMFKGHIINSEKGILHWRYPFSYYLTAPFKCKKYNFFLQVENR